MYGNDILMMMFAVILIFTVFKIKAIYTSRKKMSKDSQIFDLRNRKMLLIMSLALIVFGTIYLVRIRDFYSVVYVMIGITYAIIANDKLIMSDEAMCYDGKYIEIKKIKKWRGIANKFLEVVHTTRNKEETNIIPLRPDSIEEISELIKINKARKSDSKGKH